MQLSLARLLLLVIFLAVASGASQAHFQLNINIRIIHVEHLKDGLRVLLRLPMPYVVAHLLGKEQADGTRLPAPYSTNRIENDELMHYLDADALRRDPRGLGKLVAQGHKLVVDGRILTAEIAATRAYPSQKQGRFATLDEARKALEGPPYENGFAETYVGDTVVDVALVYKTGGSVYSYDLSSTLNPGLEGQEKTANLLLDHFPGGDRVFRIRGLLEAPVQVSRSAFAAAVTFIKEGVRHILEGADHVLFVLCLVLGAATFANLLWRVTGFTLGHTITLSAGFFGLVPSGDWFVPAVETAIALSIIYAAAIALSGGHEKRTIAITGLIGLLHGLGFSFVLKEILQVDSPGIWQSLLAFNLGVELGQIAIVLVTWPILYLLRRYSGKLWHFTRWGVALSCIAVAALWTGQRGIMLFGAL